MRVVRIYGTAPNLRRTPPAGAGDEVWLSNSPTTFLKRRPRSLDEWTRWINVHSLAHMRKTYPRGYAYLGSEARGRPVYLQQAQPDVPTSVAFPRDAIQQAFAVNGQPNRYFTCTVCWLIAWAVLEGFTRIELWGFALSQAKRRTGPCYHFERPCVFYWIDRARAHGVDVVYQKELQALPFEPGDPTTYTGPLYGYDTT